MSEIHVPTQRTRVVREPDRAVYDCEAVYRILDEGFICNVGFVVEGQAFVIPTSYGRKDANLYVHGSAASRMLRQLRDAVPVCVTVTLLDGLVLARSVFNHSMNYRSVVVLGKATLVDDLTEKLAALRVLSEHILPGRWDDARKPNDRELKATSVLRMPIEEFSAKVRTGPPIDDEEDYSFPTWAGVIPLEMIVGEAISDPRLEPGRPVRIRAELFACARYGYKVFVIQLLVGGLPILPTCGSADGCGSARGFCRLRDRKHSVCAGLA